MPSRQLMRRYFGPGKLCATAFTETGACSASRIGRRRGPRQHAPATPPSESKGCLTDLHRARQQVAFRAHHRSPKPVQHSPGGLVAAQAENPLQPQRADALFLVGDGPRRGEPHPQRRTGLVEEGPSRDAAWMSAGPANQPASRGSTRRVHHAARRAIESGWPPQPLQVSCARFVTRKPVFELVPRLRVVLTGNGFDLVHAAIGVARGAKWLALWFVQCAGEIFKLSLGSVP